MSTDASSKEATPEWMMKLVPVFSLVLGAVAFWYTWSRWQDLTSGTEDVWYEWARPAWTMAIGIVFLAAAVIYLAGKSAAGWSAFKLGWVLVPVMLFTNLILLLIRVVQGVVQGHAWPIFEKIADHPLKFVTIPAIIIALIIISKLTSSNKSKP